MRQGGLCFLQPTRVYFQGFVIGVNEKYVVVFGGGNDSSEIVINGRNILASCVDFYPIATLELRARFFVGHGTILSVKNLLIINNIS